MKAGIIIPYRDRLENLKIMLPILINNLKNSNIDYKIIIVNQDDNRLFNRGSLINIGINILFNECDYFIIHDVDYFTFTKDIYKYKSISSCLVYNNSFFKAKEDESVYNGFFSGVMLFTKDDYLKFNGFSNKYWGWGCEDTDSSRRCKKYKINMTREKGHWNELSHKGVRFNNNPHYKKNLQLLNIVESGKYDFQTDGYKQIKYKINSVKNINNDFISIKFYNEKIKNKLPNIDINNLINNVYMYNVKYLDKININTELCGEIFLNTLTFNKLFSKYLNNTINTDYDLIVKSCLSGQPWNTKNVPYIYWSGENRLPKKSKYDITNFYVLTTIENNMNNYIYIPYCLESNHIYKERLYKNINRKYLIGYCASNKVKIRESVFNKFVEKVGINKCISFGSCYGSYKETNRRCGGDFQNPGLIKNYSECTFVIAMENSIGDGYVTEKIVNAFYSGAIPIYWGSSNINELFNKNSFINISDFNTIDDCIEYVCNLTDKEIEHMTSQNIYTDNDLINIFNNNHKNNKVLQDYKNKISNFMNTML